MSRFYDKEFREVGLRATQYTLLRHISDSREVRQRDLSKRLALEDTTLTRNLRALANSGWVAIRVGADRRERFVSVTPAGLAKLKQARPAWLRAQQRIQALLPGKRFKDLLARLPEVAHLAARD
jgi:DNA-binding MarR family transcriptional regulator